MIKVMFLPLNFGDVIQKGVYDAFLESGCELAVFDYFGMMRKGVSISNIRSELIKRVGDFKPDLLHLQIQHTTIIDYLTILEIRKRYPNIIISNATVDVRNYVPKPFKDIGKISNYNFITSTSQLDIYRRAIGSNVYYWQIGYDPLLYHPMQGEVKNFQYDAIFIANYTNKENYPGTRDREKLCDLMRSTFGHRFGLFGGGWPSKYRSMGSLAQRKLKHTYYKSFCSISLNHYNDLEHYFSDRLLMCLGCGRPTISYRFPKWETFFADNCDLVIANSVEEIPQKIKYLLKNRELAEYIGKSGAEKVFAEHTYLSRIQELLKIVGLR